MFSVNLFRFQIVKKIGFFQRGLTNDLGHKIEIFGLFILWLISIITLMIIENRAPWLARSFAMSRYNHRAVIITLKARSFRNGRSFSLFSSYYFPCLYCVDFSLAFLYPFFTSLKSFTGFYTEVEPIFFAAKGAIYYVAIATLIFSHIILIQNTLFSRLKISCFRAKAHLVFHWCLNNKKLF